MIRSFKHKQSEANDKYISKIQPLNLGYCPDISFFNQQSKSTRKSSLRDLPQIENGSQLKCQTKQSSSILSQSGKKAIEIVKEAQQQLCQIERTNIKQKKVRSITIENQSGMDFTFAQNFFSNKDYIRKEFSAHSLKKRFFV